VQERCVRQRLLLIGLTLLLAIPLVLLLRDFTRDVLLAEVMLFVWSLRVILGSLPQLPIWLLFVILVFFISAVTLLGPRKPEPEPPQIAGPCPGQVGFLATRLRRVAKGEYFRWDLARYVSGLVLDVLAYRQRTSAVRLRQRLRVGDLDVPPDIEAYLRVGQSPIYTLSANLASRVKRLFSPETWAPSIERDIEKAIHYMEDQLEAHDDYRDR
jgi:hypothetical protein